MRRAGPPPSSPKCDWPSLDDECYRRVIIQVDSPSSTLETINQARSAATPARSAASAGHANPRTGGTTIEGEPEGRGGTAQPTQGHSAHNVPKRHPQVPTPNCPDRRVAVGWTGLRNARQPWCDGASISPRTCASRPLELRSRRDGLFQVLDLSVSDSFAPGTTPTTVCSRNLPR